MLLAAAVVAVGSIEEQYLVTIQPWQSTSCRLWDGACPRQLYHQVSRLGLRQTWLLFIVVTMLWALPSMCVIVTPLVHVHSCGK